MECGWFLLVAGGEHGAGEFWSADRGCDVGRVWILQVAVWRMGAFERRLLASVVDVSVIMQLKFQRPFVEFYKAELWVFSGPCAQVQGRKPCPQEHGHIIRYIL